jgi:hypothetical protein
MKTQLFIAGAAAALVCASSALAQPAASPQPRADQASPPAAAALTDDQLKSFAAVAVQLQKNPTQDQAAQAKAIEDSGLTVAQYNDIATRMRSDQALTAKIQQFARASQTPSSTESPTSSADPRSAPANDAGRSASPAPADKGPAGNGAATDPR